MVDRLKSNSQARIKLWPVAALRIYTGIFFTYNGFRKVVNDKFTDGMVGFLNGRADHSPEFYRSFVESVVIPNKEFFAVMVTFGEIAIGLTLILGLQGNRTFCVIFAKESCFLS